MGQLIGSSRVFATPGMSPLRKRSGPWGIELHVEPGQASIQQQSTDTWRTSCPREVDFAMITTLFTNPVFWVGRG